MANDLGVLRKRHQRFSAHFTSGDLPGSPRLSTIILTCVDSRVDPAHVLGLNLGDAYVMRNAGARISGTVVEDLAILTNLAGSPEKPFNPELLIIRHTHCATARLATKEVGHKIGKIVGLSDEQIAAMAITDPAQSLRDDIQRLRYMPEVSDDLIVSGFVYDVSTGSLVEIVPSTTLAI